MTGNDLVTALLPVLSRSTHATFNVFDVMHHGRHEKQLSNVFGWLLDIDGSHGLGDRFLRIFIDEVNRDLVGRDPVPHGTYFVRQEVNTVDTSAGDIADLVVENDQVSLVVENYYTSDGHGHDYYRYLAYSQRMDREGVVVLLCLDHDGTLQNDGWEQAAVVTYRSLIDQLRKTVGSDHAYQRRNADAYSFIDHLHRKFVKGTGRMEDKQVLDFLTTMCETGEIGRYRGPQESAAEKFAADIAEQARGRLGEGRQVLQRVKEHLRNHSAEVLRAQINATLGKDFVVGVSARYSGIYQWTINLHVPGKPEKPNEGRLQLKFGPSAWYANEEDRWWTQTVARDVADYSRLFITWAATVHQSTVTLAEVLGGLAPTDRRLHDEIIALLPESRG